MVGTTLPAVVRVVDLPTGTTVTGLELFEAVQTTGGVGLSVQLSLSQMVTSIIGGLPTGGATGTILNKSSGSNFSTQFSAINAFVNVGTALATSGSATSIVAFVPNQGITSTQIANNAVGTNQLASSIGIASTLSVGTQLTVTGTTVLNGGLQVTGTSLLTGVFGVVGTSIITGNIGVIGTSLFTGTFGVVGTSLLTGAFGIVGTTLFTSGAFGVVGTSIFTGTLNIIGTSAIGTSTGSSLFLSPSAAGALGNLTVGFGVTGAPGSTGSTDTAVAVRFSVQNVAYDLGVYASGNVWLQARLGGNLATNFPIVLNPNGGGVAVGTAGLTGNAILGVQGTALFTSGSFGVVGTTLFTSTFGVVGTSTFTGVHNIIGTTSITGALGLGNLVTGFLSTNGTGLVTATTIVALATATSTALGADVNLNATATYFDGPSIAQGNGTGVWFVTGNVVVTDTANAQVYVKLWDGATVIASIDNTISAGFIVGLTLSGFITSPAGNLRLSCRDISNTSGKILFNTTGNSKDSNITAIRIG